MEKSELGRIFSIASSRIAESCSELYESLFDEEGQPLYDIDEINAHIRAFQRQVGVEADLIRQAIIEYKETNG